jgi:hypothetical protein
MSGITANYAVQVSDHNTLIRCFGGSNIIVYLTNLAVNTEIHFMRDHAANVQFAESGASVVSVMNRVYIANQNAIVTAKKIDASRWVLFGDLI